MAVATPDIVKIEDTLKEIVDTKNKNNFLNDLNKLLYKINSDLSNYSGSIVKAITDDINTKAL